MNAAHAKASLVIFCLIICHFLSLFFVCTFSSHTTPAHLHTLSLSHTHTLTLIHKLSHTYLHLHSLTHVLSTECCHSYISSDLSCVMCIEEDCPVCTTEALCKYCPSCCVGSKVSHGDLFRFDFIFWIFDFKRIDFN